jgi:PmbA protein
MESLLKKATKSADAAEVYSITSEEVPVAFEANKLKLLETKRTTGRALRIIRRGRIGLAASTVTTDSGEDDLVRMAVESSEIGDAAKFDFPGKSGSPDDAALPAPQIYDPSVVEIKADELVDIGKNMISIITAYDPEIRCDINLSRYIEEVSIVNSNGGGGSYRKTGLFCGLAATAIDGNDILMVYRGIGSCRSGLDFRALAEDILETLKLAKKIVPTDTGQMPVLFTPRGFMTLLLSIRAGLNGKTVYQGASPLAEKMGLKAFDSRLSIYDDATFDWAVSSLPIDGEGVPTQRTPLIEEGVVRNFYYDLQTAGLAGTSSTGNGFREARSGDNFEGPPTPATTNLIITPGDTDLADIIASIDRGIIVDQTIGAGQGNILSGEFSINVHLGFKVKKGKIVGRVKNTMVAGNALEALDDIEAISKQTEWVYGEYSSPWFLIRSLGVATKSE